MTTASMFCSSVALFCGGVWVLGVLWRGGRAWGHNDAGFVAVIAAIGGDILLRLGASAEADALDVQRRREQEEQRWREEHVPRCPACARPY